MTEPPRKRSATRQHLLRAAAGQFARRAYHDVGLDDILAEAELTKGAMYFHFPSKHALALAIIEQRVADDAATVQDLSARELSGLETIVDFCYQLTIEDIRRDASRAALILLGSLGPVEGPQAKLLSVWLDSLNVAAQRAIAQGDVAEQTSPNVLARVVVSLYLGMRITSNLDDPQRFFLDLEENLVLLLTGFISADRLDYFRHFVKRRTSSAITAVSAGPRFD